jgi:hypothetical protein
VQVMQCYHVNQLSISALLLQVQLVVLPLLLLLLRLWLTIPTLHSRPPLPGG